MIIHLLVMEALTDSGFNERLFDFDGSVSGSLGSSMRALVIISQMSHKIKALLPVLISANNSEVLHSRNYIDGVSHRSRFTLFAGD